MPVMQVGRAQAAAEPTAHRPSSSSSFGVGCRLQGFKSRVHRRRRWPTSILLAVPRLGCCEGCRRALGEFVPSEPVTTCAVMAVTCRGQINVLLSMCTQSALAQYYSNHGNGYWLSTELHASKRS